jgi:hypothetical protein
MLEVGDLDSQVPGCPGIDEVPERFPQRFPEELEGTAY